MNKKIVSLLASLVVISVPLLSNATGFGGLSPYFGGQVVLEEPCDTGLLLTVKEPIGVVQLMWTYGELPYAMFIPPHIGQSLNRYGCNSPNPLYRRYIHHR